MKTSNDHVIYVAVSFPPLIEMAESTVLFVIEFDCLFGVQRCALQSLCNTMSSYLLSQDFRLMLFMFWRPCNP